MSPATDVRRPFTSSSTFPLSDGLPGTAQTIAAIRRLVHQAVTDPQINRLALSIVQGVPSYDFAGEAQAIFSWVTSHIAFRRDVRGYETLRSVREILFVGAGDCDDLNGVLLPALLTSVGIPVRLVTIATDAQDPSEFSHIYSEAWLRWPHNEMQWVPLDAALPNPKFGVAPMNYFRKRAWSLNSRRFQDLGGMGDFWSGLTQALPSLTATGVTIANAATGTPTLATYPTAAPVPLAAAPATGISTTAIVVVGVIGAVGLALLLRGGR